MVTLTATADVGSTFAGWSGDCDAAGSVTMTADRACTASFTLDVHTLTVTKAGTGTGTVTSVPLGIDCGIDCTEPYDFGTVVTLTAAADIGSTFAGWSGDCDAAGSVTMTADRACTATFTLDVHTLTVTKAGTGAGTVTSVPLGIDCGIDCTEPYDFGTVVTLTATADVGSTFAGWSGDCDAAGSVTMTADGACTASFTLDVHTLTVTKAGTGNGGVTSSPLGIDCGIDCTEVYDFGTVVTLTAAADVGSTFAGWSGDCDAAGSVTMTADGACTASFTLDVHTLTVTKAGTGTGTVTSVPLGIDCGIDCAEPYDFGTVVTLTAAADVGSTFAGWSGDCDAAGSVTMTADRACTASFTLDVHTLTVTKAGTGTGTVTSVPLGIDCGIDCTEPYDFGTVVTLTAAADIGSTFAGWSGDCDAAGSVTMTADRACTATFTLDVHTLTVTKAGTGTGTVTSIPPGIDCGADCAEPYDFGTVVTLTAAADVGSTFAGWSGDCDAAGSVTMTADGACTASFTLDVHTLTVTKAGTGNGGVTSSPLGIDCGIDCTEVYDFGTVVTLTAAADVGSTFAGWSGDCDAAGSVTMTADGACTASFTLDVHTLTVTKAGTGTGTVTSVPLGIDCGIDCAEPYDFGTVVTLTAAADVGSTFAGWSGDCDAAGSVTMTADRACTASFTLDVHTLTVTKAGTGTGTVTSVPLGIDCGIDCTEPYDFGTVVTLTAAADIGSTFAGWSGDCDAAGSVTMTADRACTATFTLDVHTLTVTKAGTGARHGHQRSLRYRLRHRLHRALRLRHGGDADGNRRRGLDVCRLERRLRRGRLGHDDGRWGLYRELHPRCPHLDGDEGRDGHRHRHQLAPGHRLRHRLH